MKNKILAILGLVLANLAGAAYGCSGVYLQNGSGNPLTVFGTTVHFVASGSNNDVVYVDGNVFSYLPWDLNDPYAFWSIPYTVTLPEGTHTVRMGWDACIVTFNVVGEPAQPTDPNQRNVYRFYKRNGTGSLSDHMSLLSFSEGTTAGGTYEQRLFKVLVSPLDGDFALAYRCLGYWGDHFVDMDPGCGGQSNEGAHGYISTVPRSGYTPLYRFHRLNPWDFVETTDWNELVSAGGSGDYGILGYVPQ